jgi:uncharacterized membrane protein HdeD (DUF308 family)
MSHQPPPARTPDPLVEVHSATWIVIAAGVISIVAGLLAIVYPDITLLALAIFAGIDLIVMSLVSLVDAFSPHLDGGSRALSAVLGLLGLVAGLVVLRRPGETLLALLLVLGIWLVVSGAVDFVRALATLDQRALRMLVALGQIALGVLVLSLPDLSLRTVAVLAGIGFVIRGALAVYLGWQLRRATAPAVPPAAAHG